MKGDACAKIEREERRRSRGRSVFGEGYEKKMRMRARYSILCWRAAATAGHTLYWRSLTRARKGRVKISALYGSFDHSVSGSAESVALGDHDHDPVLSQHRDVLRARL